MTTISERIRSALSSDPSLSQAGLARACSVKQPSVSDWLSGRTKQLGGSNLLKAAKYLNVRPEWLADGVGDMRQDNSIYRSGDKERDTLIEYVLNADKEDLRQLKKNILAAIEPDEPNIKPATKSQQHSQHS